MRGYVLPVVLALLLAAPMLWRLDFGDPGNGSQTARVVFDEMEPSGSGGLTWPVRDDRTSDLIPVLPAAAMVDPAPDLAVRPVPVSLKPAR